MEIDFLGLNSSNYNTNTEQKASNEYTDSCNQGIETSLCLRTSSSISKNKTCYNSENVLNKEQVSTLGWVPNTGFRFDLNDKSTNSRNVSQLPCCTNVYNGPSPKKANKIYSAGNVSKEPSSGARKCSTNGYAPTVAMARKATLARFLEKRLHRMNQARTSHIGKSMNTTNSEACYTSIATRGKTTGRNEQRLQ